MPRTIDSPAVILPEDAPHPESYRPDLPLRSELAPSLLDSRHEAEIEEAKETSRESGFEDGYSEGRDHARRESAAEIRTLETDNAALRAELAKKAS